MTNKIAASTGVERTPLPRGRYLCTILDFEEPKETLSRKGTYYIAIVLEIDGCTYRKIVVGYLEAMVLLYRSKTMWVGRKFPVKVDLMRSTEETVYNSFTILWEQECTHDKK